MTFALLNLTKYNIVSSLFFLLVHYIFNDFNNKRLTLGMIDATNKTLRDYERWNLKSWTRFKKVK